MLSFRTAFPLFWNSVFNRGYRAWRFGGFRFRLLELQFDTESVAAVSSPGAGTCWCVEIFLEKSPVAIPIILRLPLPHADWHSDWQRFLSVRLDATEKSDVWRSHLGHSEGCSLRDRCSQTSAFYYSYSILNVSCSSCKCVFIFCFYGGR